MKDKTDLIMRYYSSFYKLYIDKNNFFFFFQKYVLTHNRKGYLLLPKQTALHFLSFAVASSSQQSWRKIGIRRRGTVSFQWIPPRHPFRSKLKVADSSVSVPLLLSMLLVQINIENSWDFNSFNLSLELKLLSYKSYRFYTIVLL